MLYRLFIPIIIIIGTLILIYKLLDKNKPKGNTIVINPTKTKFRKIVDNPSFRIPVGVLSILYIILLSLTYVKIFPMHLKILIILLDFIITYLIFNFFINNQKSN